MNKLFFTYSVIYNKNKKYKFHISKGIVSSDRGSILGYYQNLHKCLIEIFIVLWVKEKSNGLYKNLDFTIKKIEVIIPKLIEEMNSGKNQFSVAGHPSKYRRSSGELNRDTYDVILQDFCVD